MLQYRHTAQEDLPKLNEWVAADPSHKETTDGSFFILQSDKDGKMPRGVQCIEVRDEEGTIFYLKFTGALIVDAEFPPDNLSLNKEDRLHQQLRMREALKEAFSYFSVASKNTGYYAMLFESASTQLIKFFEVLGFKRLTDFFKVNL